MTVRLNFCYSAFNDRRARTAAPRQIVAVSAPEWLQRPLTACNDESVIRLLRPMLRKAANRRKMHKCRYLPRTLSAGTGTFAVLRF
jgi:hypothetical protein